MAVIGFIGLGVMGVPMCSNIAKKHDGKVLAFDVSPQSGDALRDTNAQVVSRIEEIWSEADAVFLSLPGGQQVESVCLGADGVENSSIKPQVVVDLSTTSVATAQKVGQALRAAGIQFADAPVARTREAAQRGELSIMVGAPNELFESIEPMLRYIGTDVARCGSVGSGQFVKLINNALLDVNVIAIAEAMVLAEKAGVDSAVMIDAVSKGSGDSYALRNHAVKSMLPRTFPEKSFPPEYKVKDLSYLLELADELASPVRSFELALEYFEKTIDAGYSGRYFTAVIEAIENDRGKAGFSRIGID